MYGYNAYQDADNPNNNIRQVLPTGASANDFGLVADACTADPNCKGFNSNGFMKSLVAGLTFSGGSCVYAKKISNYF